MSEKKIKQDCLDSNNKKTKTKARFRIYFSPIRI